MPRKAKYKHGRKAVCVIAIRLLDTGGKNRSFRDPMANKAEKWKDNAGGKFYVDQQCIDCDLCRETAPDNFKRNDDGGYSFVFKQPENPDEEARCKEAKEGCPVEAIGDNA